MNIFYINISNLNIYLNNLIYCICVRTTPIVIIHFVVMTERRKQVVFTFWQSYHNSQFCPFNFLFFYSFLFCFIYSCYKFEQQPSFLLFLSLSFGLLTLLLFLLIHFPITSFSFLDLTLSLFLFIHFPLNLK